MASEIFRGNVGIVLIKADKVLVFERIDVPDAWQLPQGGIDIGELPINAVYRELLEETGLTKDTVSLLDEYPEWLAYELPQHLRNGKYLGQVQRWFIFKLDVEASKINLQFDTHQEFSQYKWVSLDELESIAVSFRKPIYKKLSEYIIKTAVSA